MELFVAMETKIEWSAGFLPQQGWASQGVGYQVEKAACVRVGDMGGVLIKVAKVETLNDIPEENGNAVSGGASRKL